MSALTLTIGLLLPWVAGIAAVAALPGRRAPSAPGELAWIVGSGYLVGAFVLTLWMRALSFAGIAFGWVTIAGPLAVLAAGMGAAVWRREASAWRGAFRDAMRAVASPPGLAGVTRYAWWALLAWVALRFLLLALDVSWQPLYPWNAWTQWATKARVWFELGRIVPFAEMESWFAADGAVYFDAAPGVPPTVPLLQVWASIALGRWDDALMNWPWWQIAVALALAVYGAMRALDLPALAALAATFLVASLPLANVHVALAGYADLPLAACYTCAVLALLRFAAIRDPRAATVVAVLALACTQIKSPGLGWAATLVPGLIVTLFPGRGVKPALVLLAAIWFVILVLAQSNPTLLGHPLHLAFDPNWPALAESYFLLGSWNLLWYAVPAVALLAWRDLASPALAPLTLVVAAGATLLFVVVAFPNARAALADQTSVNRVTLQFAPLAVVFVALAFRAFSERMTAPRTMSGPSLAEPDSTASHADPA